MWRELGAVALASGAHTEALAHLDRYVNIREYDPEGGCGRFPCRTPVQVGGGIFCGWVMMCRMAAAALRVTGIFGRRRVPKISRGLSIFIYCELWVGRGIPVDAPVFPDKRCI